MAFYRLEAKIISRESRGRSVVAASAYRSGSKMTDSKNDKICDYTRREKGVIDSAVLTPEGASEWATKPETLWNTVEHSEVRKDAKLAREFILAVPEELSDEQQFNLAVGWAKNELISRGMIAEVSLHHSRTGRNPHVHILCTTRQLDGEKFAAKKESEWDTKTLLFSQRATWGCAVNKALEEAGRPERVDHRSLKDQGIDRIPEPKIGVAATAMKRRGFIGDPERFKLVRFVKALNEARPWARAIEKFGEVRQYGMGQSWWERSLVSAMEKVYSARETVMDVWRSLSNNPPLHRPSPPSPDRGPEMEL
jgi:ATP-dependent exoDNAse (exonuclease V) alpha subunit